eukprot:TRINITY_DN39872_c0_g1_i1.p1 TRINITY_DN39872_c0_g1~~TRINITY_DN39872_c0_g1_i1.p1  ORF type:complete len:209 (-),score=18.85 TRINITY_DN39872_c0_g1_i1:405-1031(-)
MPHRSYKPRQRRCPLHEEEVALRKARNVTSMPARHDDEKADRAQARSRKLQMDNVRHNYKYGNLAGYYPYGTQRRAWRSAEKFVEQHGEVAVPIVMKSGTNWWDCGRWGAKVSKPTWKPKGGGNRSQQETSQPRTRRSTSAWNEWAQPAVESYDAPPIWRAKSAGFADAESKSAQPRVWRVKSSDVAAHVEASVEPRTWVAKVPQETT